MLLSVTTYSTTALQYYSTTALQHYSTAALQHYSTTALQHCSTAALQHYGTTALQHYSTAVLQHYSTTALQHYSTTALQHYSTTALQHCSSTRSIVTSVNSYQLKRNVTVHNGTADPSSAVLCCGPLYRSWLYRCVWTGIGWTGAEVHKGCTEMEGCKKCNIYKASINVIHGTVQHVVLL